MLANNSIAKNWDGIGVVHYYWKERRKGVLKEKITCRVLTFPLDDLQQKLNGRNKEEKNNKINHLSENCECQRVIQWINLLWKDIFYTHLAYVWGLLYWTNVPRPSNSIIIFSHQTWMPTIDTMTKWTRLSLNANNWGVLKIRVDYILAIWSKMCKKHPKKSQIHFNCCECHPLLI